MGLFLALLYILLYVAVAVLCLLVIIWIVEQILGFAIPARIKQLLWVIVLILVIIAIVETVPFPALPFAAVTVDKEILMKVSETLLKAPGEYFIPENIQEAALIGGAAYALATIPVLVDAATAIQKLSEQLGFPKITIG